MLRNNGFSVNEAREAVERFGPEWGVRIALRAIAEHLATRAVPQ
jgi:hypothetical protein